MSQRTKDATIMMSVPPVLPDDDTTIETLPLDSYQPPNSHPTVEMKSPPTVGAILAHLRRPPAERLTVESRVAAGGMGAIDVAVDPALDRRIAIKTLHPHLRADDVAVRMFLREARLTGLLEHPHIVPVYDLGERADGQLFFAMKLVEGSTLAALISALPRGVIGTATLYGFLDVIAKVCDALAFAHSRGVLHCDVKPANVMVGEFGQVYLMDWGIGRFVSAEAAPGSDRMNLEGEPAKRGATDNSIIGTPGYMSPEQARGDRRKLDARSDIFLLGATLYELLTHRAPYLCSDRTETLALASACAFPQPRKVVGDAHVPVELERIVLRAMAKAPADRYQSVTALKEDLVRFMRGGAEFPRQSFGAGDVILREGEPGDAAYIVVEGHCEIRSGDRTVKTLGPGDVFGEMAILTEGPRTASVVATTPITVLVMTAAVLEQELAALKPWVATLLKSLAGRFRHADTQKRAIPLEAIGRQILMNVLTWGEDDGSGSRCIRWSELSKSLEAELGLGRAALAAAIAHYGLDLDVPNDRLTVDATALRERLGHAPPA